MTERRRRFLPSDPFISLKLAIPILTLADPFLHRSYLTPAAFHGKSQTGQHVLLQVGIATLAQEQKGCWNDVPASVVLLGGFHPWRRIVFTVVCAKNGKETCAVKRSLFRGGLFLVHARNF